MADQLLGDAQLGVRVGSLVKRDDGVEVGSQRLGLVCLRDPLRGGPWNGLMGC